MLWLAGLELSMASFACGCENGHCAPDISQCHCTWQETYGTYGQQGTDTTLEYDELGLYFGTETPGGVQMRMRSAHVTGTSFGLLTGNGHGSRPRSSVGSVEWLHLVVGIFSSTLP